MADYKADVVIIGAGPVGLFAVFECGMMNMNVHVIDSLAEIGGQCTALYPEKPIYDIPAHPKILAADLIKNLEEQGAPFRPTYHLNQQVVVLKDEQGVWHIETSQGTRIATRAIIVAAGVGAFGPNRPPLEHIEHYEGRSVFYYVTNKSLFRGKRVVIAGGGDSAVDWALALADEAARVAVVHRRPKFRAAPDSVGKLMEWASNDKIDLHIPYQLDSLKGENGQLTRITLKDMEGCIQEIEADYLLSFFGLSMNLGPITSWGLSLDKSHIVVEPTTCATSAPGVFAIGDVATYPNKQKLILVGFSEAAQAAHAIRSYLHPDETFHFQYSTTQGVPGTRP